MLLKPIGVATAAALVAASATNAFLIPPQLSELDIEVVEIIEASPLPETAEKVAVELDCPGCPIRVARKEGVVLLEGAPPNHLDLSFSIDRSNPESDRLLVNGFELYPSASPFQNLAALQVLDGKKKREERDHVKILPQKLGYSLQAQPLASSTDGSNLELILVNLQIIEVGDVFINDIPNVQIKVIKGPNSKLMIGSVETTASQTPSPDGSPADCTTLMCKWIAFAKDKMRQMKNHMKPCHGTGKGMGSPGAAAGHGGMMHHGGHAGHGADHDHHHDHHGQHPPPQFAPGSNSHSFGKLMKNIASHILLPVLIGVVAGVSASLIGMAVGTLIVSLWRTFFRRRAGYTAVVPEEQYAYVVGVPKEQDAFSTEEEKSGLIQHQGPPPAYEADDVDVKKTEAAV